ncbi:MAG TPA: type IV pilus assembly protein PilM [Verrucomicrobiae bacterium]|jgi:type IV pilus assembly protein PilM|nr:type IV pilus assembly protein PilM [Verrucomicrobiae bacterium]
MLNSKSFLAVDFGAGSLKLAEFEQNEAGGLRLKQYGVKPLGIEGSQEQTREAAILKGLQELLSEKTYSSKQINVCAPGFHVFSKFVKLPPVDTSKVTQIIRYEAQQNVPFPLDEVVWDYQILGASATNELEVLLVAVKTEIIEGLFRVAEGAGLKLKLVDVSQAALCNAFRYNYGEQEGCTMLLDIGAKTSNLLFFEKGKVFSRSINIGSNSITQDFANEAKLKFPEAEAIKIEKGSVSLGGAYEDPEDPQAAAISKIARQVMTKLHIQINQTIQFFRGQQGGSAPQRLFLSGGASILPYTAQFFAEKLNVPVDYFNPFRSIELDASLDLENLSKFAHSFGEVVGLGLRDLAHCPVELNLMPKSSIERQEFAQKKLFLVASVFAIALGVFFAYKVETRIGDLWRGKTDEISQPLAKLKDADAKLTAAISTRDSQARQIEQMRDVAEDRFYWMTVLSDLRTALMRAEGAAKTNLYTPDNKGSNTDVGVWVQTFSPVMPGGVTFAGGGEGGGAMMGAEPARASRFARGGPMAMAPVAAAPVAAGQIEAINLIFMGLHRSPTADADLAFTVQQFVTNVPSFTNAILSPDIRPTGDDSNTFTFSMTAQLKRPLKL